ncbi:MAG: SAM-dependent methyltransferase [Phycisphaerae bacterium]|nr:SAM-dependent methyltransferase [Phycisphaerae bacterium]
MIRDVEGINDLSWAYRAARTLQVASNLRIFDVLAEGWTPLEEVCRRCRSKPELTGKLLIALAAMELVEKRDGRYRNAEAAEAYLVRGRALYQGDIIAHSASVWKIWDRLEEDARVEPQAAPDEERHRNFILGMHNLTMAGRGELVTSAVNLSGRRKLLDVGGGPGTYSIMFCRRYPDLRAEVFDLPETVAIAREIITKEGMADRVTTKPGDWNTDEFGEGADVVLMSNILHGEGSQAAMKLAKARRAMVNGGVLVVQDFVLNDEKTGPLNPALFNIMVGAYSRPELFGEIERSGFGNPQVVLSSERFGNSVITAENRG